MVGEITAESPHWTIREVRHLIGGREETDAVESWAFCMVEAKGDSREPQITVEYLYAEHATESHGRNAVDRYLSHEVLPRWLVVGSDGIARLPD